MLYAFDDHEYVAYFRCFHLMNLCFGHLCMNKTYTITLYYCDLLHCGVGMLKNDCINGIILCVDTIYRFF